MSYVDFFALPLPKDKQTEYLAMAKTFAAVMKDYGMLSFCEAVADDVPHGKVTDWYRAVAANDNETIVTAFYVWPDRATRDHAWEAGMKDPRMKHDPAGMPFDGKRMFWGGFKPIIEG